MDGSFIVVSKDSPSTTTTATISSAAATTVTTTTTTTTATKTSDEKVHNGASVSLLQKELQALSTPNKVFQNWAQTFRCVPEQYYTPSTEEEIIKVSM